MQTHTPSATVDGVLLLDKPLGISSNHAMQRVKRLLRAKKAGHGGTLDPQASGMLIIACGQATKFLQYMIDADKTYIVTAQLGIKTETGDREGAILMTQPVPTLTQEAIEAMFKSFIGQQKQTPPMYSALKHQGQPLYVLARRGLTVERPTRSIHIKALHLHGYTKNTLTFSVRCSKGTYIRCLVEDMGDALGCGAYVQSLHRSQVGDCCPEHMVTMAMCEANIPAYLHPCEYPLPRSWPSITVCQDERHALLSGQALEFTQESGHVLFYSDQQHFLGVGELEDGRLIKRRLMAHDATKAVGDASYG